MAVVFDQSRQRRASKGKMRSAVRLRASAFTAVMTSSSQACQALTAPMPRSL